MSNQKRALVVDDSRSARLVLRRMLEKYGLLVDTVESAAQALDFLIHNRPDVIFMDHMMPGMDGFEAVKAIKNNPDTATIPVMMYTSKGGDLYLGQARALGAVGVLPKTVAPAELFQSLLKIGLVTERRSEDTELDEEDASERAEDLQKISREIPIHVAEAGLTPAATPDNSELDLRLRRLLEEQSVELRKDVLLSLETVARQTSKRLNRELDEKLEQLEPPPPAPPPSILPVILLTGLLFVSLAWNVTLHGRDEAQPETTAPGDSVVLAADPQAADALNTLQELQTETAGLLKSAWQTTDWALNQELNYPYDEIALDGQRAETVAQLLERLSAAGYRGTVILETHAGEFCLLGDQQNGFRLPAPDLTVDKCEFIGNPVQPTDSAAAHQSLRFANFISSTPLLADENLDMEVVAASRENPLFDYPEKSAATSAQDWNRAAARNNRVIIHLQPLE